jgi:hypothetical protein
MAMLLSFYIVCQYLFGIGLRRGIMWVKVVFLTVTILAALMYLTGFFSPIPPLLSSYNTPIKAFLLGVEYFLSLWAVVVIFQGFGVADRASLEQSAQPVAPESADAGAAQGQ